MLLPFSRINIFPQSLSRAKRFQCNICFIILCMYEGMKSWICILIRSVYIHFWETLFKFLSPPFRKIYSGEALLKTGMTFFLVYFSLCAAFDSYRRSWESSLLGNSLGVLTLMHCGCYSYSDLCWRELVSWVLFLTLGLQLATHLFSAVCNRNT